MNNAAAVFDIIKIFESILGYTPARVDGFPPSSNEPNPYQVQGSNVQKTMTVKGSPIYGLSDVLGRSVFCPVTIKAGSQSYDFPYMVIGMKTRMILKETPMVERGGSVIEEIGVGRWEFACKGFLIDPMNQFPDDQIDALNNLYQYRQPINIICPLTDLVLAANDQVVMSELDIPAKPKVIGVKEFAFTLLQDSILDLTKTS